MMIKRSVSLIISSAVLLCAVPAFTYAEDTATHTVTVLDFDGNVLDKLTVADGQAAPLNSVDISSLEYYESIYTQVGFSSWSCDTSSVTGDMTVQALYKKMTIALVSLPKKTEYYSPVGNVDLTGLKVTITVNTQLPDKYENGNYKVSEEVLDISSKCTTVPANIGEAFASGDKATIKVYPINSEKAIGSYDISYYSHLGDADMDGSISSLDASYILKGYSFASVGEPIIKTASQKKRCDVDNDGSITSIDASLVLKYYAFASTKDVPCWEEVLNAGR